MGSYLPQEIVETIVDKLGESIDPVYHRPYDKPYHDALEFYNALGSCLQVSRGFAAPSRRHLFRTVDMSVTPHWQRDTVPRAKALQYIMSQEVPGGGIVPYIESFILRLDHRGFKDDACTLPQILADILNNLHDENHGITQLTLRPVHDAWFNRTLIDWSCSTPVFQRAFLALCQSPHLRKLNLIGVFNLPPTMFDGTHLQALHLFSVTFSSKGDVEPQVGMRLPPPKLEFLETDRVSSRNFNALVAAGPSFLDHIQELRIPYPSKMDATNDTHCSIAWSGKTLKRLHVFFQPGVQHLERPPLDLQFCPNVEYLELHCISNYLDRTFSLPDIPVPATSVRHLRVRVQKPDPVSGLDDLLARETFPSLSHLSLDLVIDPDRAGFGRASLDLEKELRAMKNAGAKCLPSLSPSVFLDINVVFESFKT